MSSNGDEKANTYPQVLNKLQKKPVTCQQFGFAIESLFNNNCNHTYMEEADANEAIVEMYFLLLFEIARRL